MDLEALQKRKELLEQERARAEALLYRLQGAITLITELIADVWRNQPEPESE
jgi:hypothetical protein